MKKTVFNLIAFIILVSSLSSCGYNSMVEKEEQVSGAWSQVENVYQRRADLIPNLVNTVKGAAEFEKGTLTAVIEARAKATAINLNVENLTPENVQKYQQAQEGLTGALSKLMMVSEAYPTLQSNQNFAGLMAELAGTENRITVERRRFNESVQDYNAYIRKFPNNLSAGMFGFEKKGYFTAKAGSDTPPTVDFNSDKK
jgi:LemA protein